MKQNLIRRVLMLLVLAMILGGIALPVWATEPDNTEEPTTQTTPPEEGQPESTEPEPEETQPEVVTPVTTADGHYIAQPGLLNNFVFPEDWSRSALEFSVGNRIMEGRDDGLEPQANITRAETAAILVRLMGAKENPGVLAGYTDVNPDAWYYGEVSAAVSVGLMKGTSETTIQPDSKLTREDACVLLSRAFGILPVYHDRYSLFSDAASVSDYARTAVSGLAESGVLKGYGDNTICPRNNITRAEFAQLVYGIVTHICDTPDQIPANGKVLYRGAGSIPAGTAVSGSLIIGYGYAGSTTLEGLTVTDRLVLSCMPGNAFQLVGCELFRLVVSSKLNVASDTPVKQVFVGGESSCVNVSAADVFAYVGCTLDGTYDQVNVSDAGICVVLNQSANSCKLHRSYCTLQGSGYSETVDIYGRNCNVTISSGKVTDHIYIMDYNNSLGTVKTVTNWYQFQRQEPYSTATMEGFVNKRGYASDTEYLIWVSTTTTTVNVFKGSQGNWKLEKSMACALGAPYSPTVKGTFKTFLRDNEWDFGAYKCRWVTYFYNGYAFHSRKWAPNYSYLVDPSINCLVSAGCVRMYDEDCYYIYSSIPVRTTVVVY